MTTTHVLMTAMPPTIGHAALIRFAHNLGWPVNVIVHTQPGEPMVAARHTAVAMHVSAEYPNGGVSMMGLRTERDDDPTGEGFQEYWNDLMVNTVGVKSGDIICSSEPYGKWLADATGATFVPFDRDRVFKPVKATPFRNYVPWDLSDIMPEFRQYLISTITVFGAESCGKTTAVDAVTGTFDKTHEWARPYLEIVGPEITRSKMETIVYGQAALEETSRQMSQSLAIIRDTDLYSTLGFWESPGYSYLGSPPTELYTSLRRSDLYIIMPSDRIEFHEDQIRYGGDKRETTDQYWIDLCVKHGLNYMVMPSNLSTIPQASYWIETQTEKIIESKFERLAHDRKGR